MTKEELEKFISESEAALLSGNKEQILQALKAMKEQISKEINYKEEMFLFRPTPNSVGGNCEMLKIKNQLEQFYRNSNIPNVKIDVHYMNGQYVAKAKVQFDILATPNDENNIKLKK